MKLEIFASYSLVFWLLVIMNGFWGWILPQILLQIVAFLMVIAVTFLMNIKNDLYFSKNRIPFIIFYAFYITYAVLHVMMFGKYTTIIIRILSLYPLILIMFWNDRVLSNSYIIFRKIFLLFSIGAICLTILSLTGLVDYFPYLEISDTGKDFYVNKGTAFRVYGFGNMSVNVKTGMYTGMLPRALGPFHEGGHFAIYLGFIITIDRMLGKKLNPLFFICGILTFSMAFVICFLISEALDYIINRKKKLFKYALSIAIIVFVFLLLPDRPKEMIKFMLYERNFSEVVSSISESGKISNALNERVNSVAIQSFDNFLHSKDLLFGSDKLSGNEVMSDFRGVLVNRGICGLLLMTIMLSSLLIMSQKRYCVFIACILFFVFFHRAWMYYSCYLQCILIMGFASKKYNIYNKMLFMNDKVIPVKTI